jgi:drug/metabolite transporter (DMT)-like permease
MPADLTHIALKPWLALLYVAVFSQWIGFFAWNAGMAIGGIARVSQVQLLQPFITFALAAFFNGETITPQILLFAAAVVATVAISTRTRRRETVILGRIQRVRAKRGRMTGSDANPESRDSPDVQLRI